MIDQDNILRLVEAVLFAAEGPLTPAEVADHAGLTQSALPHLTLLADSYAGRGIELVERGGRWHFQTPADLAHILRREKEAPRRLSRAAVETLAIIAYHEPVSRAEIESIRGAQVARGTLDVLMETGWIRPAGRRETPGRPLLYATTPDFLTHFGLSSRRDLPGIEDLRAAGLLEPVDAAMELALHQSETEGLEEEAEVDDIGDDIAG